jgi:Tfp pilus assembly protein PilZ
MKTVLNLIGEFGALNDAKVRTGGSLPPEDEKRWAELKAFYEVLMAQTGLDLDREAAPITASDIREQLMDRERIRVPVEVPVVFQDGKQHHSGKVMNLSRGGTFIASEHLPEVGSQLTVYIPQIGSTSEEVLEIESEVVWLTKRGVPEIELPRGIGVQFTEYPTNAQEKLDSFVIETIARKLSSLW